MVNRQGNKPRATSCSLSLFLPKITLPSAVAGARPTKVSQERGGGRPRAGHGGGQLRRSPLSRLRGGATSIVLADMQQLLKGGQSTSTQSERRHRRQNRSRLLKLAAQRSQNDTGRNSEKIKTGTGSKSEELPASPPSCPPVPLVCLLMHVSMYNNACWQVQRKRHHRMLKFTATSGPPAPYSRLVFTQSRMSPSLAAVESAVQCMATSSKSWLPRMQRWRKRCRQAEQT